MSNFNCKYCGVAILDSENGYVTECEHYPGKEGPTTTTMQRDMDYALKTLGQENKVPPR